MTLTHSPKALTTQSTDWPVSTEGTFGLSPFLPAGAHEPLGLTGAWNLGGAGLTSGNTFVLPVAFSPHRRLGANQLQHYGEGSNEVSCCSYQSV